MGPTLPAAHPLARARRLLCLTALALGLGAILWPAGAMALSELVPAYFGPEGSPDPWHTMCAEMSAGSTAIVNPDNGPVKREAKAYLEAIGYCHERGQKVIGYVYTRYGKRSIKSVEKAIGDYYSWYPTVDGIFLDEMTERPTAKVEAYYATLERYVHEKGGIVVGNPGDTASTAWQLSDVDEVVTFEGSAAQFTIYEPASWVLQAKPGQIADIIFAATDTAQMEAACEKAGLDNAGSVYVTNLPEKPNPYETLPAYWSTETERC
jgi:Spherulation-specific family 4